MYNLRFMIYFVTICLCRTQPCLSFVCTKKGKIVRYRLTGATQKASDVILNSCTFIYVHYSDVVSVGLVRPTRD